jgi:hypothetical protein
LKSNIGKVNRHKQQSYRNTGTHVDQRVGSYSNTDHKIDAVHQVIKEQLAPRIAQKSSNAVLSDRRAFFYYKRKKNGRRCSCFGNETSPDSDCLVCYGTGFVGGYDKYGTHSEIIDYTKPYVFAYGVKFDYENRTVGFVGTAGSYIEAEVEFPRNARDIDTLYFGVDKQEAFKLSVISPVVTDIDKPKDLQSVLNLGKIRIRITFLKDAYFQFLLLRFVISDDNVVYADIANNDAAPSLDNFGEFDSLSEIPMTFSGSKMSMIDSKDILYRLHDGAKLKVTSSTKNIVAGTLTEVTANARFLISMDKIDKKLII